MRRPLSSRLTSAVALALVSLMLVGLVAVGSASAASADCEASTMNVSAALAGGRVTVSPSPDSRDASSSTQISMLGVPAAELQNVTVAGSRSGRHVGSLLAYSQGDGASFCRRDRLRAVSS